ncbi:MAG: LysM peptidoglycan-binding domain-containing protein [Verrucomicrobia bacterium]|nr:LysM peptidoglycan-binding domain-containing protein [Verrucomicrobiota bacterium]
MEEDYNTSSTGILPLALAVLALVIGGAGLYFGLNANQALRSLQEMRNTEEGALAKSAQEVANLKDSVKGLTDRNKDIESAVSRLRAYGNERDKRIKNLTLEVDKKRDRTEAKADAIVGNASQSNSTAVSPTVAVGNYPIQSGDTFSSIASKSGVKLQALLDANPGVDPRRLRIGQTITIPGN